ASLHYYHINQTLHCFPTRRSSDLLRASSLASAPTRLIISSVVEVRTRVYMGRHCGATGALRIICIGNWTSRLARTAIEYSVGMRSEEDTSELQSPDHLVGRLLRET